MATKSVTFEISDLPQSMIITAAEPTIRLIVFDGAVGARTVSNIYEGSPQQVLNHLLQTIRDAGIVDDKFRVRR